MTHKNVARILAGTMALTTIFTGVSSVMAEDTKDVTLMLEINGYAPLTLPVEMAREKFPDYNIISKEWSIDGVKKAIKTTFASGGEDSIDIAFAAATYINSFVDSDMLLDLTPYLEEDPEWKDAFIPSVLEAGTYNGKVYGIPWQSAYPVLVANMDIFDELGIEPSDDWTYDEMMEVCEKIKEAGYFPLAHNAGGAWFFRQAYLNAFESEEDLSAFNHGEISFRDERVESALDKVAEVYNKGYCYPGEGAIAATDDEITAAMANGKIAMAATTNNGAALLVNNAELENWKVINFPTFSNTSASNLLGSPDVYIVPSNAKNVDAVIDVLKYITGREVLSEVANLGTVIPLTDVESTDPNYGEYSKDMGRLHPEDICNLTDELGDYINAGSALTNYLYDKETALDDLERMRESALAE